MADHKSLRSFDDNIDDDVPMHRASHFAKHVLPCILIVLCMFCLCCRLYLIFRRRCCCNKPNNKEKNGVAGKNGVMFVGGDDALL